MQAPRFPPRRPRMQTRDSNRVAREYKPRDSNRVARECRPRDSNRFCITASATRSGTSCGSRPAFSCIVGWIRRCRPTARGHRTAGIRTGCVAGTRAARCPPWRCHRRRGAGRDRTPARRVHGSDRPSSSRKHNIPGRAPTPRASPRRECTARAVLPMMAPGMAATMTGAVVHLAAPRQIRAPAPRRAHWAAAAPSPQIFSSLDPSPEGRVPGQ